MSIDATDGANTRGGGASTVVAIWHGWFLACWVLWLVMAGTVANSELVAGAAVAVVAATAAVCIRGPAMRASDIVAEAGPLAAALASVPRDLGRMVRVLARELARRPSTGSFEIVPFDAGDGQRAEARRAMATITRSLAPNEYVVGIDAEAGTMLVHRLTPDAGSPAGRRRRP